MGYTDLIVTSNHVFTAWYEASLMTVQVTRPIFKFGDIYGSCPN